MKKILIAMSGGVDSSVAAYLLKQQGFDIAGITMKLKAAGKAGNAVDVADAAEICRILGAPHYTVDLSEDMEAAVINPFINEYMKGRTPNPCVICNKYIKFGKLFDKAIDMGFDGLATGHYARIKEIGNKYYIRKAVDPVKDQSYFLYSLKSEILEKIIFPLGELSKQEIKSIAEKAWLPVVRKKESQDICFYSGENSNEFFTAHGITENPGEIVDLNGKVIGTHKGIWLYTIGKRRGLGVSAPNPLYVISIDAKKNRLVAAEKKHLYSKELVADILNFNDERKGGRAVGKIRYAHKPSECEYSINDGKLHVTFDNPQESITPGQSIVLYDDDIVIGGGIINEIRNL